MLLIKQDGNRHYYFIGTYCVRISLLQSGKSLFRKKERGNDYLIIDLLEILVKKEDE